LIGRSLMRKMICLLAPYAIAVLVTCTSTLGATLVSPEYCRAAHAEDCVYDLYFWNSSQDEWLICEVYVHGEKVGTELVPPLRYYSTCIPYDPVWEPFRPEYYYYDLRGNFCYKIGTW
ncbi:MAG: hypothetical protein AAF456_18205, partial [Planctomycetota bacterium]